MGDLREDLLRLAEGWETQSVLSMAEHEVLVRCARNLRSILASHPSPSPSVLAAITETDAITEHITRTGAAPLIVPSAPSPRSEAEGPPKLIERNTSTEEGRQFWASAEQAAAGVESWPDWKRAGINEAESRARARSEAESGVEVPCPGWPDCEYVQNPPGHKHYAPSAPVPAESATRDLLRVVEHPAVPEGTAYAVSVVEGPDGEKRLDAVKLTGVPAESAAKGEEDGRRATRSDEPQCPESTPASSARTRSAKGGGR